MRTPDICSGDLSPKIAAKAKNKGLAGEPKISILSSARDSLLFQSPERFYCDRRPEVISDATSCSAWRPHRDRGIPARNPDGAGGPENGRPFDPARRSGFRSGS